jgi:hypothetical protein
VCCDLEAALEFGTSKSGAEVLAVGAAVLIGLGSILRVDLHALCAQVAVHTVDEPVTPN